ncbi:MAG: hypothetical protein MRY78_12905, partial [Saprospiraceae bacterium]|nr:hypothetical protein [Saprospiraceae bacterium]
MKYKIPFVSLAVFVLAILLHSFASSPVKTPQEALDQLKKSFHAQIDQMGTNIALYLQKAEQLDGSENALVELQDIHLQTRLAFKKIEFLLEYYDRDAMKKYINGAPLPTIEKHVPEIRVIEPSGLQVLDELVFGDAPFEEKEEIIAQVKDLQKYYAQTSAYQKGVRIDHRHVFEAVRQELIRIMALGVTGFDTPGSVNAIPEAMHSMTAIKDAMGVYVSLLKQKDAAFSEEFASVFAKAVQYLKDHNDFDTFDRLTFVKSYINPLYGKVRAAQQLLQVETVYEATKTPLPTRYHADHIFSDDFLNEDYFANVNSEELSDKRIELGKLLFFDPALSSNNKFSCATCHQPDKAFTDGLDKSLAIKEGKKILRNAPTVINSVYAERYFYDLREPSLERQIRHVVVDSLEFNTDFFEIVDKLSESETYKKLFAEAYADQPKYQLSKWSVSNALACYVVSLSSYNSPFDQYVRGERDDYPEAAKRGFNLFMGKAACGTCHFAPSFNGLVPPIYEESETEVLGVPATTDTINPQIDPDLGRMISTRPQDEAYFYAYSFKTPTVRNAALTAPYMHNGVYETMEEVIDFYNKGGGLGLGIDIPHQTLPGDPLNLNKQEVQDLIAFMETLTDT